MSNFALPMDLPKFSAAVTDCKSQFAPARLAACVAFSLAADADVSEAVRLLTEMIRDSELEIRAQAVESLATLAAQGAVIDKALLMKILADDVPEVRAVLLQSGDVLLENPLETAEASIDSDDDLIRYSATILLGALAGERALELLEKQLTDASCDVRLAAAFQLGENGNEQSAALLEAVAARQEDAAPEAIVLLAELGLSRSEAVLAQLAARRFGATELKTLAIAALARIRHDSVSTPLLEMFESRRRSRRQSALRACAAIPVAGMAEPLAKWVQLFQRDEDSSAALWALWTTTQKFPATASVLDKLRPRLRPSLLHELADYEKG